jgi:hypothetical protein
MARADRERTTSGIPKSQKRTPPLLVDSTPLHLLRVYPGVLADYSHTKTQILLIRNCLAYRRVIALAASTSEMKISNPALRSVRHGQAMSRTRQQISTWRTNLNVAMALKGFTKVP